MEVEAGPAAERGRGRNCRALASVAALPVGTQARVLLHLLHLGHATCIIFGACPLRRKSRRFVFLLRITLLAHPPPVAPSFSHPLSLACNTGSCNRPCFGPLQPDVESDDPWRVPHLGSVPSHLVKTQSSGKQCTLFKPPSMVSYLRDVNGCMGCVWSGDKCGECGERGECGGRGE